MRLGRLKSSLTVSDSAPTTPQVQQVSAKLPDLNIPKFNGNYLEWSTFSELFKSIIIDNNTISDIERLQYLHSSVTGEASLLIKSLPLTGDSFKPAWENLQQRYCNKRMMMQAQFDKLLAITPIKVRNATSLNKLINTVRDVDAALKPLATPEERWNALLIHVAARSLDKATREAWETKLGSAQVFPPKNELATFITSKVRALESLESSASGSSQPQHSVSSGQRSSNTASQARATLQQYPCDCCSGDHFIVSCTKFRALSVKARRQVIANASLCWNCCGRHTTANCKSVHRCKECKHNHHTLLHLSTSTSAQAQTAPAEVPATTPQAN